MSNVEKVSEVERLTFALARERVERLRAQALVLEEQRAKLQAALKEAVAFGVSTWDTLKKNYSLTDSDEINLDTGAVVRKAAPSKEG